MEMLSVVQSLEALLLYILVIVGIQYKENLQEPA